MLSKANIGISISNSTLKFGDLNADYVVNNFRQIGNLFLVHGR